MKEVPSNGYEAEALARTYSLPEGVVPKLQQLDPLTADELEAIRQKVYGDRYLTIKTGGKTIVVSAGMEYGARKYGTME